MERARQVSIQEGDWVGGTSLLDEKFIGFVHAIDGSGVLKIWVTQSDHEPIVGDIVETRRSKVKKLADYEPKSPEELRDFIELALMTHDKAWFDELSSKLALPSAPEAGWHGTRGRSNPRLFGIYPS